MVTAHSLRDFIAFVGVNVLAIVSSLVLLPLMVEAVVMSPLPAQAPALVVTALISDFGHCDASPRRRPTKGLPTKSQAVTE